MCRWIAYLGETTAFEHYVTEPEHSLATQSLRALQATTGTNGDGYLRPEARSDTQDQARIAPQGGCRARHRPSQSRAPYGRNYLAHRRGDAANAVLAAAGYNFRRLIRWLRLLLRLLLNALSPSIRLNTA